MSSYQTIPKYLQPQELSQESKDFISTLPKQKTHTLYPLYQHQGFWYNDRHLLGAISSQKHFEAHDSDVFLATSPKCGTTWLKALTFALLNRKRLPVAAGNHPLLTSSAHDLVPYIDIDLYADDRIPDMEESFPSPPPRLFATHMPYVALPDSIKENKCKLVYVTRNPKDTFVSLWHFVARLGILDSPTSSIQEAFEHFCKGVSIYGPFWDHVLDYWKQSLKNPERILFLKYEDMKAGPAFHLRRLAEFLDCPFTADEEESGMVDRILKLCSFDHLSSLEVNKTGKSAWGADNSALFRRGEVGDWKNYLSAEISDKARHFIQGGPALGKNINIIIMSLELHYTIMKIKLDNIITLVFYTSCFGTSP